MELFFKKGRQLEKGLASQSRWVVVPQQLGGLPPKGSPPFEMELFFKKGRQPEEGLASQTTTEGLASQGCWVVFPPREAHPLKECSI